MYKLLTWSLVAYVFLLAYGVVPVHRDPEKNREIHRKLGSMFKLGAWFLFVGHLFLTPPLLLRGGASSPEDLAAGIAAAVGSQIPRQVDEVTWLESAEARGAEVHLLYRVISSDPLEPWLVEAIRADLVGQACAPQSRKGLEHGVSIHHRYETLAAQPLAELSVSAADCEGGTAGGAGTISP